MYCKRCGSTEHWDSGCPRVKPVVVEVDEIVGTTPYVDGKMVPKAEGTTYVVRVKCPECGSTPEIFSAAKKWFEQRDKRKRYMREYRKR